jgi:hypothetical protein
LAAFAANLQESRQHKLIEAASDRERFTQGAAIGKQAAERPERAEGYGDDAKPQNSSR